MIIDRITFKGMEKIKPSYLKKLLTQKEGLPYDYSKKENDLILLLREPAVSHVYTSVDTLAVGQLNLIYHIKENKILIPVVNFWPTVNKSFAYHLGITEYNFTGRGYIVGAFYRQNNFPGFGLIFENNNFMSAKTELKLLVQQIETLEPIKLASTLTKIRYRIQSLNLSLGREINLKHKIIFGAGILGERYLSEETTVGVPTSFSTTKGVIKLGYQYDYTHPQYFYLNGWRSQTYATYVEGKSITPNNAFYALENETSYFK